MKIKIRVYNEKVPEGWLEEVYTEGGETALQCGQRIVDYFNATLRPGELPRTLRAVSILDADATSPRHDWKKTNLVTIVEKYMSYDTYVCTRCGAKGKRYGLDDYIIAGQGNDIPCKGKHE